MRSLPHLTGAGLGWLTAALHLPLLTSPAPAQDGTGRQSIAAPEPGEASPVTRLLEGGPIRWVPIPAVDDAIPLPEAERFEVGEHGDVPVAAAAGDPFQLGFAAGFYAPASGERVDPALTSALEQLPEDGRTRRETYAFVMFERRITPERVQKLESLGARVLGHHPRSCVRVALDAATLTAIAQEDFVRWVGLARPWQKVHPDLSLYLQQEPASERVDVVVSVFESDLGERSFKRPFGAVQLASPEGPETLPEGWRDREGRWRTNGRMEQRLEALGMRVDLFSTRANAFRGSIPREALEALVAQDFVQFIERQGVPETTHDESTPMIHADLTRASWNGGTNGVAVVGEADTGIDNGHSGLNHIWGWGWDLAGTSGGAWTDGDGHGSHVAGTVFGRADTNRSLDGVAFGLGSTRSLRIFNVKAFNDAGNWGGSTMTDILDRFDSEVDDGQGNITPRPHVINQSWGTRGNSPWIGTEVDCRELDFDVWLLGQMHVFAAANDGPGGSTIRLQATAKNVFSVGNIVDHNAGTAGLPGSIWTSSSRGPTGDDRWKPNVVAPGRWIRSADANTSTGYVDYSGTSMAAPHVAGLAAQLVDHYSFLRYRPAVLGAVMMATATTKDGVLLSAPSTASTSHHNTYGAGRVEAYKAHNLGGQGLSFWQVDMTSTSSHVELDFDVAAGATQLSVVMLYNEMPASAGASAALVNDIDMYLDAAPFSAGGNVGDYSAHRSSRDNVETRILANPTVGAWKVKLYPRDIPGLLLNTAKVGVAVVVTYGDTTPAATLTTSVDDTYVRPNETVELTATVNCPSYVATSVFLTGNMTGTLLTAETTLADGRLTNLMDNPSDGAAVTLGNIRGGQSRAVRWTGRWSTEGIKSWRVDMDSENAGTPSSTRLIYVDGTPPTGPQFLATNHPVNSHSCDTDLDVSWTAATDSVSGVLGYRILVGQNPNPLMPVTTNLGAVTSYSTTLAPSTSPYYVHLRAQDRSGNWGPIIDYGPFWITAAGSSSYCIGAVNSTGAGASISRTGSLSIAANTFTLRANGLPNTGFGLFIMSQTAGFSSLGDGFLCVGGTITRLGVGAISGGAASYWLNFNAFPVSLLIDGGETWRFQTWYRDAGGAGYNLSNGLVVTFCD